MTTHSVFLPGKIPWTENPGRLQSMELQTVGHYWTDTIFLFKIQQDDPMRLRFILYIWLESSFNIFSEIDHIPYSIWTTKNNWIPIIQEHKFGKCK